MTENLDREEAVRRLFRSHGYQIVSIRHTGHWQVKASRDGGPVRHFTVSTSPSSPRARFQLLKALRRGYSTYSNGNERVAR